MRRREMAQVVVEKRELDRINDMVEKFDPRTHPLFEEARKLLSRAELQDAVDYVSQEIPVEVGLQLIARAAGEAAEKHHWATDPMPFSTDIDYRHNPCDYDARDAHRAPRDKNTADAISDAEYGLIQAAKTEFFGV
jgi:hypothetical protein